MMGYFQSPFTYRRLQATTDEATLETFLNLFKKLSTPQTTGLSQTACVIDILSIVLHEL
jgi:hypothetical protein